MRRGRLGADEFNPNGVDNDPITGGTLVDENSAPQVPLAPVTSGTGQTALTEVTQPETSTFKKVMNVNFSDDRETLHEGGKVTEPANSCSTRILSEMPDNQKWDLSNMLERPSIIDNVQWQMSDTRGHNIWSFDIPNGFSTLNQMFTRVFENFTFLRWDAIRFTFQANTVKMQQGSLRAYFIPFNQFDESLPTTDGEYRRSITQVVASQAPSTLLNASQSTTAELDVVWTSPLNFIDTINPGFYKNLGTIYLMVYNPLVQTGTCASDVYINVYMQFINPQVFTPIYQHTPVWTTAISEEEKRIMSLSKKNYLQHTGLIDTLSTGFDALKDIGGNIASGNFSAAVGKGARHLATAMGYDKPLEGKPETNMLNPIQDLCHGGGISDKCTRLGLHPSESAMIAPEHAGATDEMNWQAVTRVYSLIEQITWPATAANGTLLFDVPVTPQLRRGITYGTGGVRLRLDNTLLSWPSELFAFWTGSIEFKIEVICSNFHTGRLLIVWDPNCNLPSTLTYAQARNLTQVEVDLQKSMVTEFTVPMYPNIRYKYISGPGNFEHNTMAECTNGRFKIYVMNPLRTTCITAPDAEINIYICAGSDYRMSVPTNNVNGSRAYIAPPAIDTTTITHTGLVEAQGRIHNTPTENVLGFGSGLINPGSIAAEAYDMKTLVKRYTADYGVDATTGNFVASKIYPATFTMTPNSTGVTSTGLPVPTLLDLIGEMYANWFGPIRKMFNFSHPADTPCMMSVTYNPISSVSTTANNEFQASKITTLEQNRGIMVELPFQTQYNIMLIHPDRKAPVSGVDIPYTVGSLYMSIPGTNPAAADLPEHVAYTSAGDEFTFHNIMPPTQTYMEVPSGIVPFYAVVQLT